MDKERLLAVVERIVSGNHSEVDIELLRQALADDCEQSLLQLGKYNVNIGQGGEGVHIGDQNHVIVSDEAIQMIAVTIHNRMTSSTFANGFLKRIKKLKQSKLYIKILLLLVTCACTFVLLFWLFSDEETNTHVAFETNYEQCLNLYEDKSYKAIPVCRNVYEICKSNLGISSDCSKVIEIIPPLLKNLRKLNLL